MLSTSFGAPPPAFRNSQNFGRRLPDPPTSDLAASKRSLNICTLFHPLEIISDICTLDLPRPTISLFDLLCAISPLDCSVWLAGAYFIPVELFDVQVEHSSTLQLSLAPVNLPCLSHIFGCPSHFNMSQPSLPPLKLKLNTSNLKPENSASTPTPSSGKIKLKIPGGSSTPKTEKPSNAPKSTPKKSILKISKPKKDQPPKLNLSRKRKSDALDDGEQRTPATGKAPKVKLIASKKTPVTPSSLKLNIKGRPPPRPKGQGYDSEASDAEKDPSIEENFILRMQPGEDCEYVRKAIEDRNWGKEGASVRLKFLQHDGRRAVLTVQRRLYAAVFVDLPCVVEGVKSWDKKAWYKVADICQMLIVLGPVQSESEAMNYPVLDREIDSRTWAYAHGLTPPMHWVRKRRFRKRTSTHTIEQVEAQVQRLLQADAAAIGETRYEVIDPHRPRGQSAREGSDQSDMEMNDEADGEGEIDEEDAEYEADVAPQAIEEEDVNAEDLEAQFESFLAQDEGDGAIEVEEAETPASSGAVVEVQQMESSEAETPAAGTTSKDESEEEESEEDDEDEVDEEELEQRADVQRQREEIADLESAIRDQIAELDRVQSVMLRSRIQNKIQSLQADLELKKSAIGEGDED